MIGFAALPALPPDRLTYFALPDASGRCCSARVGAIVLMIAGADELLDTGAGLFVWLAVLGAVDLAIVRVWTESQSY